jgi:hypothetical protein
MKKKRMAESRKEAKQLVQGTLLPVTTLSNVARVIKSSYSYESAHEFLSSFATKVLGPRKQATAKVIAPSDSLSSVKFVFTEKFTKKCCKLLSEFKKSLPDPKSPVGVRVSKVGVIGEEQLQVMVDYHDTMDALLEVSDAIEWMTATSLSRLRIPEGLGEYAELDKAGATVAMQQIVLPMSRDTPFGRISNRAMSLLREDLWLNDDCMMDAMATFQEEHASIGIISPGFSGTESIATQHKVIAGSRPFEESNTHVPL